MPRPTTDTELAHMTTDELKRAVKFLNKIREVWDHAQESEGGEKTEPPFHLATNTFVMAIAGRENKSIKEVVEEIRGD